MVNINTECVAMVSVYHNLGKCVVAELKKKSINQGNTIQKFDCSCHLNF